MSFGIEELIFVARRKSAEAPSIRSEAIWKSRADEAEKALKELRDQVAFWKARTEEAQKALRAAEGPPPGACDFVNHGTRCVKFARHDGVHRFTSLYGWHPDGFLRCVARHDGPDQERCERPTGHEGPHTITLPPPAPGYRATFIEWSAA